MKLTDKGAVESAITNSSAHPAAYSVDKGRPFGFGNTRYNLIKHAFVMVREVVESDKR